MLVKQVDSSLSMLYIYNDVKRKSYEQGLITRKCIATLINHF